eukprot:TRINITY_DN14217_c0_g1_i1.p1 TRINITY_DN14217_c0_g1~~TRINITY_DN14217_c0_g1_i1.p1  ORF type:complete len:352 (+),score=40.36 TRINITY_DN14217_c0_g1_i1:80-1135(+)
MAAPAPGLTTEDCRICLGEGWCAGRPATEQSQRQTASPRPPSDVVAADATAELIAPCRCSGSIGYVHKQCLQQCLLWDAEMDSPLRCSICKTDYNAVVQWHGMLTSPALLAVTFRQFVAMYCQLATAMFAAAAAYRAGFSWATVAARSLLGVTFSVGGVWAIRGLWKMLRMPGDSPPEDRRARPGLVVAFVFIAGYWLLVAVVFVMAPAELFGQLYTRPGAELDRGTECVPLSDMHMVDSRGHNVTQSERRIVEPTLTEYTLATAMLLTFGHGIVTSRVRYIQPMLQVFSAIMIVGCVILTPVRWVACCCAVILTLLNAVMLRADINDHPAEHCTVEIREPHDAAQRAPVW